MDEPTRLPLGQVMVQAGLLTQAQLDRALEEQRRSGRPLGEILVEGGFVSGGAVANALAEQHGGLLRTEYGVAVGLKARRPEADDVPLPPPALPGAPSSRGWDSPDDHAAALAARFGDRREAAPASTSPAAAAVAGPADGATLERIAALETEVEMLEAAREKALEVAATAIQALDALLAQATQRADDAEAHCALLEAELATLRVAAA